MYKRISLYRPTILLMATLVFTVCVFVIASICIMAEHKIKDKNIFKIMMAIFLMGGIGVLTTVDFSEYRKIEMVIKCIKFIFGNGRILSGFGYIAVGWIVAKRKY